jgi:hypothetical protein
MKTLISALLILLSVGLAAAQSGQAGVPGLDVVESSWRRIARHNPALDDPLRSIEDQNRVERASTEDDQRRQSTNSVSIVRITVMAHGAQQQ